MVDLHMHSNFSDGTDAIEDLVKKIIESGIEYFSITDHDTILGVKYLLSRQDLLDLLNSKNIKFTTGVEFSGIINDNKVHLLGYNYDSNNPDIEDAAALDMDKRNTKYNLRLKALKEQGIEYSKESLDEMGKANFLGKPLMAKFMIKDNIVKTMDEAYNIIKGLKIPSVEIRLDAKIILSAINNAGGVGVWAHPLGGINEPRVTFEKVEEILSYLIPLGLKGLECYYNLYTKEETEKLVEIAKKYNLFISAGSDYHGKNKKAQIGEVSNFSRFDATQFCNILDEIF